METLSPHQIKIGRLVALGYGNREIAEHIGSSETAIKSAIHAMFDKLGVWNRVELANRFSKDLSAQQKEDGETRFENHRLALLKPLYRDDKALKQQMDDLIAVAATVCDASVALIVVAEAHRLWFKAAQGIGVREAARRASFCQHAISESGIFEVKDARADERFRAHPFVVHDPFVRFYAGVPLIEQAGYPLGTLCVLDQSPKELNESQRQVLERLGRLAMNLLDGGYPSPQLIEPETTKAKHKTRFSA